MPKREDISTISLSFKFLKKVKFPTSWEERDEIILEIEEFGFVDKWYEQVNMEAKNEAPPQISSQSKFSIMIACQQL